jgi:hypothetical protein
MRSPAIAPAAPREPENDHCDNGCVKETNQTYACRAKGCGKDHLCSDCTWSCDGCSREFCEEHTTEVEEGVFLCGPCLLKRSETPPKPIELSSLFTDADLFGYPTKEVA